MTEVKTPVPPFSEETARIKVRMAEDAWNSRDPRSRRAGLHRGHALAQSRGIPRRVAKRCGNSCSASGRANSTTASSRNCGPSDGARIAVRFAYEWHDDSGHWYRSYGNENWQFDANGFMQRRFASINDLPIGDSDRKFHWPLGRRPDDHPGLSDLDL